MTDSIKRLLDFVAENGGIPLVANKTGLTESVFHNYKNPKRKNENVGGEVHAKMKSAFPNYSADYIITGVNEIQQLKEELKKEKEEKVRIQTFYIQKEMALVNFHSVYTENLLVDDLDKINELPLLTRVALTGQSFNKDLVGNS